MANGYDPPKLLPGQLNPSEVAPQPGPNGKYVIGARPSRGTPNAGLSATHGMGPHGATPGQPGVRGGMTPTQVRAMQQFLNNHGFQVAQDGMLGPMTKSAAAAFRANHKGGEAWNKMHGIGTHPGVTPVPKSGSHVGDGPTPTGPTPPTGPTGPSTPQSGDQLQSLIDSMLSGGGAVGSGYDPSSFGDAAAAPDQSLVQSLIRQIGANPKQESQDQSDISSWYGLDPKASSYKLSVLGRLAQARAADAGAATSASSNIGDLAKSLAGSIGGAANDGSGQVLAAGTNAAGTMDALGEAQKQYADQMDPLLRAEAVGAASKEKAANSQSLADLADKLASARGQATSDRAQGVMSAQDKNNALAQQRFANQGNLLSMEAQLQAADPNANTLDNAKTRAQINEINAQAARARAAAQHLVSGASSPTKLKSANIGNLAEQIGGIAGIGIDHRLPAGMSIGGLAHLVGSTLITAGIPKTDPRYQRIAQTIMGSFLDPNGNPLNVPPGWFGPNTQ
jgi:hypothetical protein